MTPEVEARTKAQVWERMRERLGDEYLGEHAGFLEHQWDWAKALRMVDEEMDLITWGSGQRVVTFKRFLGGGLRLPKSGRC